MVGEPGVMHLRDLRPLRAPFGDAHGILVLALDSNVDSLEPALEEPAGERIRRLPPDGHLAAHFVDERLAPADDASENVVVTVEIFGGRMDHHVHAVLERPDAD